MLKHLSIVSFLLITLTSCGGGGSSQPSSVTTPTPPPTPPATSVAISSPAEGDEVEVASIVVQGTSENATQVFVSVNQSNEFEASARSNSIANWSVNLPADVIAEGQLTLTARAVGEGAGSSHSIAVTALPATNTQVSVEIVFPAEDDTVIQDDLIVTGTASNATRVLLDLDGLGELQAEGTQNWSRVLASNLLNEGLHTLTARAVGPNGEATDSLTFNVSLANVTEVDITTPTEGQEVSSSTLVVAGTSANANAVALTVDGTLDITVNGTNNWDAVIEEGLLTAGGHTLRAVASGDTGDAIDEVSFSVSGSGGNAGLQEITYTSSVDGETMTADLYIPTSLEVTNQNPVPLFVYLHGGGGFGVLRDSIIDELEARGWIGIAPDGRLWNIASQGCTWMTSAAYVDSPNEDVGPGEQDIFDAIEFVKATQNIDDSRVYLSGFSMGGRGAYIIGLKNPDKFAAIAPFGPASDMYEIFHRRPEPRECKESIVGGEPRSNPMVDTMYTITSSRFLIENAFNLPVFHGHGKLDNITYNRKLDGSGNFLHGYHILQDDDFDSCHGNSNLCFGHTPTLNELSNAFPNYYDWAFMYTDAGHQVDDRWITGTENSGDAEGVIGESGQLIGAMAFLASKTVNPSPNDILFKTYTDTHKDAFWLSLTSQAPWTNRPAAVHARTDSQVNQMDLSLTRANDIEINIDETALSLQSPLTITLDLLDNSVLDPALKLQDREAMNPTLTLRSQLFNSNTFTFDLDGAPIDSSLLSQNDDTVTIGPLSMTSALSIELTPHVDRPVGIYSLGHLDTPLGIRDYDFISGYTMRMTWEATEPTKDNYQFDNVVTVLQELEQLDQFLTLEIFATNVPAYLVNEASETYLSQSNREVPVPWDANQLERWGNYISALSSVQVELLNGDTVNLPDHPNLKTISTPIVGLQGIRELTGNLIALDSYNRQTFIEAAVSGISEVRDKFPKQYGLLGTFRMNDANTDQPLDEVLVNEILNIPSSHSTSIALFQETLSDDGPITRTLGFLLEQHKNRTPIMFQALTAWTNPFTGEDRVTSGTPSTGIAFALDNYDARYVELYQADVDDETLHEELKAWSDYLTGVTAERPNNLPTKTNP